MATLVLQTAGTVIGGALGGPFGAVLGRAAGAIGGNLIDQQLFGASNDRTITGPRLDSTRMLSAREGQPIARVYGRARIAGEIIWATRFEEETITEQETAGGKGGGPKSTTTRTSYAYFANFAIGLCEGAIGNVGRIWVDGKELDQVDIAFRVHAGSVDQPLDPLVSAKQGANNTPAYRGTAYMVFEHFPLADYGNRIPQISVEVVRPVSEVADWVRAVNIIPGSTEFGYDPRPVSEMIGDTSARKLNRHQTIAPTDFLASLRDLRATCPRLEQVALVVAWFGDDLRVEHCRVEPRVEVTHRHLVEGDTWTVGGLQRGDAKLVSRVNGAPAYGGTPSDASVIRAIDVLRAEGLRVCINPFVMMDVPSENGLPDPYGGSEQAIYPWRGRISTHPAVGQPGSPDQTTAAVAQLGPFISGPASYRAMILHYAGLCAQAGGVDMFIIGSELRGLTRVRGENDTFPFVAFLKELAAEVRAVVGPQTQITYGADWSEYFGYQPTDGSGDVFYNLDPLWSDPNIDAVGIDNYMPLSDWRDEGDPERQGRFSSDPDMLAANVERGEGYDYFYATPDERSAGVRSPITDGAGKPWVYRYKDIKSWWNNSHIDRRNGAEVGSASAWIPQSKPIIFTELGCPAVHNGAAQPNVFVDPKSSESAYPHFSSGGRDDDIMLSTLRAQQLHWDEQIEGHDAKRNPVSFLYGAPMVDARRSQLWAWDARPYPTFPARTDIWNDGQNWSTGHWLNGRLSAVPLGELIRRIIATAGATDVDVSGVYGVIQGYVLGDVTSPRQVLEGLMRLYRISLHEDRGTLVFRSPSLSDVATFDVDTRAFASGEPSLRQVREHATELPRTVKLLHIDPQAAYRDTDTSSQREAVGGLGEQTIAQPIVADRSVMQPIVEQFLADQWRGRDVAMFSVPPSQLQLSVGDQVRFTEDENAKRWTITEIEDGAARRITARAQIAGETPSSVSETSVAPIVPELSVSVPKAVLLDLPELPGLPGEMNRVAVAAKPWPGAVGVYVSETQNDHRFVQLVETSAIVGRLTQVLPGTDAHDRIVGGAITLKLVAGRLQSIAPETLLGGGNAFAIRSNTGGWEIVQALSAELMSSDTYRLTGLLRGQLGSAPEALAGSVAGADVVLLNKAVEPLEGAGAYRGLVRNWLIGPSKDSLDNFTYSRIDFAPGNRSIRPFRPVHLKLSRIADGHRVFTWIRCDRNAGENWDLGSIPMSEDREEYRVRVIGPGGPLSEHLVDETQISLPQTELAAATRIDVAQISAVVGVGPEAALHLSQH